MGNIQREVLSMVERKGHITLGWNRRLTVAAHPHVML